MYYEFENLNYKTLLLKATGKVLKKIRKNENLHQSELANLSQISRNHISLIETGQAAPTIDIIFRLCHCLNISPSEFINYIEKNLSTKFIE